MTESRMPTLEEIRRRGLEALSRELGPAGMARFLQQFESGRGDYTTEREQWLADDNVEALAAKILEAREPPEDP